MKATVRVPGACGELWQGTVDGKQPALITCPIDWYSTATVSLVAKSIEVYPNDCPKAHEALVMALNLFDYGMGYRLKIDSMPRAKGLGSSTADIAATIYATVKALDTRLAPNEVAQIAISIEPSDGLMFPGFALFDHRGGKYYEDLSSKPYPDLSVIILGFPGEVDTLAYNQNYRGGVIQEMVADHREALSAVRRGLRRNNLGDIGYGATLSARCHQRVLYKPQLESVIRISKDIGAVGVNVAHSGTVIGILADSRFADLQAMAEYIGYRIDNLEFIHIHKMVPGGPRYEDR